MDQWTGTVLSDGGVGKTSLAVQFTLNCFVGELSPIEMWTSPFQTYDTTIEDAYHKQFVLDNHMCFVEVIDTASQEEYATLRDQWCGYDGQGFILVYSITSRSSFDRLEVFRQSCACAAVWIVTLWRTQRKRLKTLSGSSSKLIRALRKTR
ncbi:ras family-domain-containing protein [Favolaschia claudopus]|uniref:Ras family-domain-containing protein n=1 Tax=Favolaschia claudopus TaxID=2862362 RepID=A0AAW0AN50_9AGAR